MAAARLGALAALALCLALSASVKGEHKGAKQKGLAGADARMHAACPVRRALPPFQTAPNRVGDGVEVCGGCATDTAAQAQRHRGRRLRKSGVEAVTVKDSAEARAQRTHSLPSSLPFSLSLSLSLSFPQPRPMPSTRWTRRQRSTMPGRLSLGASAALWSDRRPTASTLTSAAARLSRWPLSRTRTKSRRPTTPATPAPATRAPSPPPTSMYAVDAFCPVSLALGPSPGCGLWAWDGSRARGPARGPAPVALVKKLEERMSRSEGHASRSTPHAPRLTLHASRSTPRSASTRWSA